MATRAPVDQSFLADLLERRIEAPDVEYKSWMPLTDNVERANIARHICALANAGGGWLVFGFDDDGKPSEPYPESLAAYGQDAINGIGERYLEPQPHCELHLVVAGSERVYPVIRVPSHGDVPVCARRDGPQERGQPQGIRSGVHYIRVAGPRSVAIDTPELWRSVLRRCVLAERATLLTSIGQLFDRPQIATDDTGVLQAWLDPTISAWAALAPLLWPVDICTNRIAFAFRFLDRDGCPPSALTLGALHHAVRSASFASEEIARGGAAFEAGWDATSRARVVLVGDLEAYEGRRLPSEGATYVAPALWRVSVNGMGTEITAIPEDNPWVQEAVEGRGRTRPWPPGQRLAPTFQIDTIARWIGFVRKLAESFPDAVRCDMAVDYVGLAGRTIDEPKPGVSFSMQRSSAVDVRRHGISVGLAALTAELPEVTASLVGPIFRLFDGWEIGPDYVRSHLSPTR